MAEKIRLMKCIDFIKIHNIYFNHFKTKRVFKVLTREAIPNTMDVDNYGAITNVDVLLTVHFSICILVIYQLDAHSFVLE